MKKIFNKYMQYRQNNEVHTYVERHGSSLDVFFALICFIPISMEMYSTFVYFYKFYILYSLIAIMSIMSIFYILIKDNLIYWTKYLFIPLMVFSLFLWTLPKLVHHYIVSTQMLCLNATLRYKDYISRDNRVKIVFELENKIKISKQLQSFSKLDGIDGYQYNNLPKKNEKIRICGQISKIGFSFDYVEAVKDTNISSMP